MLGRSETIRDARHRGMNPVRHPTPLHFSVQRPPPTASADGRLLTTWQNSAFTSVEVTGPIPVFAPALVR